MKRVFIDGQEGTTGLQIYSRLQARPDISLITIDPALRKEPAARKEMLNQADVAILCLPDDAAREAIAMIENADVRVIDTSTAHRTLEGWAYGLPELSSAHRERVRSSKRIAVPGCHATGFITAVYPLVAEGILAKDAQLHCHSITGFSGGGKRMIAAYQAEDRPQSYDSPRQYGLSQHHKHLPEMRMITGLDAPPVFSPIVCDFYAGMAVSIPLHGSQLAKKMGAAALLEMLSAYYAGQRFISVHPAPEDGFLPANELTGTNDLKLYVCGDEERITLTSVLDNLGKGASGAAMQCMNIALEMPEDTGF